MNNQKQWMQVSLKSDTSRQIDEHLIIQQPQTMGAEMNSLKENEFNYDLFNNT